MPDLSPILAGLAFLYGAAMAGALAALPARRWVRRGGRVPAEAEAAWCVWLPPLAVLLLPLVAALSPEAVGLLADAHHLWHDWERRLHGSSAVHGALHAANLLLLGLSAYRLLATVSAGVQARGALAALRTAARETLPDAARVPIYRLVCAQPACFTAGALRPAVYVTTALLEELSPRDRRAMLAHEIAHVRRRDGLTGAFLALFYSLLPLPGGRLLRAEWERAAERACDAEAARHVGSPLDVAAALVQAARLTATAATGSAAPAPASGAWAFAESEEIEERVQALLTPAHPTTGAPPLPIGLALACLTPLLAAGLWMGHAVALFVHH